MTLDTRETMVSIVGYIGSSSGRATIDYSLPTTQALLEHTNKRKMPSIVQCEYYCHPANTLMSKWGLDCRLLAI